MFPGARVVNSKSSVRPRPRAHLEVAEVGTVLVLLVHDVLDVVGAPSRARVARSNSASRLLHTLLA